MKIRQAVVTSSVETLEGRQGLGLVLCSRSLPEKIRQLAKEFEHSSGADGQAIYCLTISEVSDDRWVVMNRAVPDIDYTGRTSHVSHTVAFREEEMKEFFRSRNSPIPSAFEFMLKFEWRSSWKEEPKWLENDSDLNAIDSKALIANSFDGYKKLDPNFLLVFDYSKYGIPKPKRLAWRFGGGSSEEILNYFHQAWLCLDPWQGTRKYKDHLGEPEISTLESWKCTFSTNLLHGRPDPYDWVVLSPEFPELGSRELIDPSKPHPHTPDTIKEKIGHPLGDLLVERCEQGPETWAQSQLRLLLDSMKREYADEAQRISGDIKNQVEEEVAKFKNIVELLQDQVSAHATRRLWSFEQEEYIKELRDWINSQEASAKQAAGDQLEEFHKKADLMVSLLKDGQLENSAILLFEPHCFPEFIKEFERLASDYRDAQRIVHICDMAVVLQGKVDELQKSKEELKKQLSEAKRELEIANISHKSLSLQAKHNGKGGNQTSAGNMAIKREVKPWHMGALFAFSILVILLVVWFIMSGRPDGEKNLNSNAAKPKIDNRESVIGPDNQDDNKRLELKIRDLNTEIKRLKTVNSFNRESSGKPKLDSEVNPDDESTPTVPPSAKGDVPGAVPPSDSQKPASSSSPPESDKGSSAVKSTVPKPNKTSEK